MTSVDTASSSSSTLWATASKEWVIAPKPRPGRKPKRDATQQSLEESESKNRKVQNRAAQRAFRERKQSQLTDLQARIQAYEQGEIERNVALQKIAKQLKDDNELLRSENATLSERVAQLEAQLQSRTLLFDGVSVTTDKKRGRPGSPSTDGPPFPSSKKRSRTEDVALNRQHTSLVSEDLSSPSSMGSTPDSIELDGQFSSLSYESQEELHVGPYNAITLTKPSDPLQAFTFDCGFCDSTTICVCREIAAQAVVEQAIVIPNADGSVFTRTTQNHQSPPTSAKERNASILDDLPAYQPPVPLRRRARAAAANSVFPVHIPTQELPTCSGDPSNCMACADDTFGQAFCSAIGSSVTVCDCSAEVISRCCGGASNCSDCPSSKATAPPIANEKPSELMPTNDAWQKIKAHPNAKFADLALLAKVVASQSKCSGPQLVFSPAPRAHEHDSTLESPSAKDDVTTSRIHRSPPLQLVPQEVLLECGRRRMRQVNSAGVNEALRLLDVNFT